jgi:hypothetical protein
MKKRPMGEGAAHLFVTGADALAAIVEPQVESVNPGLRAVVASVPPQEAQASSPMRPRFVVTTVRLAPEHWEALRTAAFERARDRGGGKADASEILREILNRWIAQPT